MRAIAFHRMVAAGSAVITLAIASPAVADTTPEQAVELDKVRKLTASTPWNIDFGESRCRLMRLFGEGDNQHVLFFEQSAPRAKFSMTLAGPELKNFAFGRGFEFGMLDGKALKRSTRHGRGDVAGIGPAVIFSGYSIQRPKSEDGKGFLRAGIDPNRAGEVNRVVLKKGGRVLSFETQNMKMPVEALNACTANLMRQWGLDPSQHEQYRPARILNKEVVVRRIRASYPRKALRREESAIFRMRVVVEPDGTASNCHLEQSTIAEHLESPACALMMRYAKFEPATGVGGDPIRSFYAANVTYVIN